MFVHFLSPTHGTVETIITDVHTNLFTASVTLFLAYDFVTMRRITMAFQHISFCIPT